MDSTLDCLSTWMPHQRWYAAKGRTPALRLVGSWDLLSPDPAARVRTLLVADEASTPAVLYQVPVVERSTATVADDAVGVIGSPEPGITLIDGPTDAAYTAGLLGLVSSGGRAGSGDTVATGRPASSAPPTADDHASRVLSGEQSNTSIIYTSAAGGAPVISKVFRQLHPGLNPDIELQTALADVGSPFVPRAVGSLGGTWAGTDGPVEGSLAFAQEFLPGVEDAWRVALAGAEAGEDFTARARARGVATATVHADLARLFPTTVSGDAERAAAAASWRVRLNTAIAEVPELAPFREPILAVYARATEAAWPALQRIHGDYHLGQVILVPDHGWVLLDFEGEPLRPMSERTRPDLALRDVAGMLRSFDYVAGSLRLAQPDRPADDVGAWAADARRAFLDGYAHAGEDPARTQALLDALEIDKAVYEAIYEARNRPSWLPIPLGAVGRLVDGPTRS